MENNKKNTRSNRNRKRKPRKKQSKIRIMPLGGVRENGKNAYVIEVNDDIFLLDCGLQYPENDLLGIDVVIPEFAYLIENRARLAGIFLTHGHADSIGALPYLLKEVSVPVFGSELTIALAKITVNNFPETKKFNDFHVVDDRTEIDFGNNVTISFFPTTHTIPETLGIVVKTTAGAIVYTGDFKFDQSSEPLYRTDFARLAEIGNDGVLALLSESSNADNPAQIASEREVKEEIYENIRYHEGRIIVASVASNLMRIQQILAAAAKTNRKVVLTGQDLEKIVRTAIKLGKIQIPDESILVSIKKYKKIPDHELLILETGRMGEPLKALQKMANGYHKQIRIKDGDLVYITTTPSIAMESAVAKTEDLIYRAGGKVLMINDNMRVSGHANPHELQLMINLLRPKTLIPVQGEYRQLSAHANLAKEVGIDPRNIYILHNGDMMEHKNGYFTIVGSIDAQSVMIDGIGIGDIGNVVLRDRRILSEDGVLMAVVTISRGNKTIVASPQVTSRGFVFMKTSRDIIEECKKIVTTVVESHLDDLDFEWGKIKQDLREQLSLYIFEETKRRPVILPVIMEYTKRD